MPRPSRSSLASVLDGEQRIVRWPKRAAIRQEALSYLASKFEFDRIYSEANINEILLSWHLFQDPAMLRRALYDHGYLDRTRDCRQYWRLQEMVEQNSPLSHSL